MRRTIVFSLICLLALSILSCSKQKQTPTSAAQDKVLVAFVSNNVSQFWTIARAGVQQGEKDFNAKCLFQMPAAGTATEQKTILEDLIVRGVTGISISPVNPENQTDVLNKTAASVDLICQDSDAPKSKRLCYIGTDNYKAGVAAGKEILKALPDGGKVMLFVGTLDALNAVERRRGILDMVKGSKVEVIGTQTDNADRVKAKANVEDTLVTHPDIAALVGLWSYNGPAIVEAVKSAGKQDKVRIVCFDEEEGTLQGVKDGIVSATIVQQPYEFGYQSVKVLAALARKEDAGIPPNKIIDIPVKAINKQNVGQFWAELNQRLGRK